MVTWQHIIDRVRVRHADVLRMQAALAVDLKELADEMAAANLPLPATPSLEAVLAAIRAKGHERVNLNVVGNGAQCSSCRTYDGMPASPGSTGYDAAAWDRWQAEIEWGSAYAADVLAAAQARLEQIKALHHVTSTINGTKFEFNFEPETGTWYYHAPGIVGGGRKTLAEAEEAAEAALAFAQEWGGAEAGESGEEGRKS